MFREGGREDQTSPDDPHNAQLPVSTISFVALSTSCPQTVYLAGRSNAFLTTWFQVWSHISEVRTNASALHAEDKTTHRLYYCTALVSNSFHSISVSY